MYNRALKQTSRMERRSTHTWCRWCFKMVWVLELELSGQTHKLCENGQQVSLKAMHCRKPQVHIYTVVVAHASGYRKGWTHHNICILAFKEEDHTIKTCPMSLCLVLWLQMNYWNIFSNTNETGRSTRRDKTWQSQNEKQTQQPTKSKCKWALNLWWREDLNVAQAVGRERETHRKQGWEELTSS